MIFHCLPRRVIWFYDTFGTPDSEVSCDSYSMILNFLEKITSKTKNLTYIFLLTVIIVRNFTGIQNLKQPAIDVNFEVEPKPLSTNNSHLKIFDQILNQKLDFPLTNHKFEEESKLVVLVLSARENFDIRNTIRSTWAYSHIYPDIYFLVGARYCPYPTKWLVNEYGCDLQAMFTHKIEQQNLTNHERELMQTNLDYHNQIQNQLISEAKNSSITSGKLVFLDMVDIYNNLSLKTKSSFQWAYNQLPEKQNYLTSKQKFFLKIDDDCLVDAKQYNQYLSKKFDLDQENSKFQYLLAGVLVPHRPVRKIFQPKWAERKYKINETNPIYPMYANGNRGYVISFDIVKYIANNFDRLITYQNEDASMGIWINEAPFYKKVFYSNLNNKLLNIRNHPVYKTWCDLDKDNLNVKSIRKKDDQKTFTQLQQGGFFVIGDALNSQQIETCWERFFLHR